MLPLKEEGVALKVGTAARDLALEADAKEWKTTPKTEDESGAEIPPRLTHDVSSRLAFRRAGWALLDTGPQKAAGFPLESEASGPIGSLVRRQEDNVLAILQWRLVVKLKGRRKPAEVEEFFQNHGLEKIQQLRFGSNLFETELKERQGRPYEAVTRKLGELESLKDDVEFAEPVLIEYLSGRLTPQEDPRLKRQWQWDKIQVKEVWEKDCCGRGRTIAVIDEGFQADHEDLVENVDVERSARFDADGKLMRGVAAFEPLRHGTLCAGMAAARRGNGRGGCGAAPEATLMLVALPPHSVASQVTLARAVAYCAAPDVEDGIPSGMPGADVISCSLGPSESVWLRTQVLEAALDFAVTKGRRRQHDGKGLGCPVFWATANFDHKIGNDSVEGYKNVIAVGALDKDDGLAPGGNGSALALLAPGVKVVTTAPRHRYDVASGASLATPCVAGVAALVLEKDPDLSWRAVKKILTAAGRPLPPKDRRQSPPLSLNALGALNGSLS